MNQSINSPVQVKKMKGFPKSNFRDIPLWANVKEENWNDWKWQLRNSIKDIATLKKVINVDEKEEEELEKCLVKFKFGITPYYASLMDKDYNRCVIRLQAVPTVYELDKGPDDHDDPLHEDVDSPVPGLTHRYPDRVLMLITHICSMYCRYCTRRRVVGDVDEDMSRRHVDRCLDYIRQHPEIRDIVVSGGDALMVSDSHLEYVLKGLREIEHVEIIRLGTRMPVVMPMRITDKLVEMIKKYHPIYVNTHFNHSKEITFEAKEACERLANAGMQLGNQTVLMRDINDCPIIMKKLMHDLLKIRVKPYYIYQCDLSNGISHFRTSVGKGIEIIESLRGHTSGLAVPTFVVDAPGGGGKIPVMPNYVISQSDRRVVLRNYEGVITTYTQPEDSSSNCGDCKICDEPMYSSTDGVGNLSRGKQLTIEPKDLKRHQR